MLGTTKWYWLPSHRFDTVMRRATLTERFNYVHQHPFSSFLKPPTAVLLQQSTRVSGPQKRVSLVELVIPYSSSLTRHPPRRHR